MIDSIKLSIPVSRVAFLNYNGYKNISAANLKRIILNNGYKKGPEYVDYEKIYIKHQGYLPACGVYACCNSPAYVWFRFSVPKLIYSNNVREVTEKDFNTIVSQLHSSALILGIDVPIQAIKEAMIWELHVGKNFDLNPTGLDCNCILSAFNKLAFDNRLDTNKVRYINAFDNTDNIKINYEEGEKWSAGCKSYEYCFYNKTEEIKKDDFGRDVMKRHPELDNVLRCEYRLFYAESVKAGFEKVGLPRRMTFETFFKDDNFKKLNMYIWNKMIKPQIIWLGFINNDPMVLLTKCINANIKPVTTLKLLGMWYLGITEHSCKTIKTLFPPRSNIIKRLEKDIEKISGLQGCSLRNAFLYIESEIEKNKPLI